MRWSRIPGALSGTAVVYAACALTFSLGLFFVFVWAPHPWGWEGFDHYHQLALIVASGEPFPTMDVPWGYAYFAAALYRLFGDRPWIVLLVQIVLNAAVPWLTYRFALTWTDQTTAALAAVITGIFSFNTIYASTQSSDAVCTVLFMTALVAFAGARRRDRWWLYAAVGGLTGLAAQFRPNLILVPACLAAFALLERRTARRLAQSAVLLLCAAAAISPWVVRNYRLTGMLLPTSVHGGVQLWYGTLQVGPYLHSRAYNPRAVFEAPVFESTSLVGVPIVVTARPIPCGDGPPDEADLVYWSDHDAARRRVAAARAADGSLRFDIPAPGQPRVLYYYFDARWRAGSTARSVTTPVDGAAVPFVYFVSGDHLGDLDVHGDLLDVFDVVRLVRHRAWNEPLPFAAALSLAHIGPDDVERAAEELAAVVIPPSEVHGVVASVTHDEREARLAFRDGSSIVIPRTWSGAITELAISGPVAEAIMSRTRSFAALARPGATPPPTVAIFCAQLTEIAVNQVFYRREPQMMRRYSALAVDNIRRDPAGFIRAAAYRAIRVFVIQGTDDHLTAQQFSSSARIYQLATLATLAYVVVFIAGAFVSWRRGDDVLLPILLVAYVPATIAPVLTNMRYSVTVQPIIFIFIAAALTMLTGHRRGGPHAA